MRAMLSLMALVTLSACGGDGDGTAISIHGDNASGLSASAGKDGAVKIDTPVFKGEFKLPKIQLDAEDFEINGVHLPPGSKITDMNVGGGSGKDDGHVRIAFASPVSSGEVRRWFAARLPGTGYKLTTSSNALTGTTDEGKSFRLEASDTTPGASRGTITIG